MVYNNNNNNIINNRWINRLIDNSDYNLYCYDQYGKYCLCIDINNGRDLCLILIKNEF
ncbi:hypothetical protein PIROE2DRAFT_6176 [Piromyces sp. E2]|nr:hypothetical protein PIROE2DRAFT_6176 [Piromyces sp. E2]|eukprot:OUM66555.1 hypothetical protein PIROE2DRAFT_6176 [Piromyces sp. E2]